MRAFLLKFDLFCYFSTSSFYDNITGTTGVVMNNVRHGRSF